MSRWFVPLSAAPEDLALELVGGKFLGLYNLHRLLGGMGGVHVPAAVCWTSEATAALLGDGPPLEGVSAEASDTQLRAAGAEAGARITSKPLPAELGDELRAQWLGLGAAPLAVRSSAADEDGQKISFAGQYETTLGVTSYEALVTAIKRSIASAFGYRVLRYRRRYGLPLNSSPMPVILQRMVDARVAGVIFTQDPRTITPCAYLEAVAGLGETLVSGAAIPESATVCSKSNRIIRREAGDMERALVLTPDGVETRTLSPAEREAGALSEDEITRISGVALRLAQAMGFDLDVEWAIDYDRRLAFLQARPIVSQHGMPR